jgi:hypothetical protein
MGTHGVKTRGVKTKNPSRLAAQKEKSGSMMIAGNVLFGKLGFSVRG